MNDFSAWDQNNWLASASLLIELAFLVAAVWFAGNLLRTMRAFQEQIGTLLKLSIAGITADRNLSTGGAPLPLSEGSPYWLAPSEGEAAAQPQLAERDQNRITVAGQ